MLVSTNPRGALYFVLLLLMVTCGVAQAADDVINTEPRSPSSNAELRLILTGADGCCGAIPRAFTSVEIEDSTIEVVSTAILGGVLSPPTPPYAFTVSLGKLEAGTYTVRHLGRGLDSDATEEIASREIVVRPGVKVTWAPSNPMEDDYLSFELTGLGTCPFTGPIEVLSSTIRIPWNPGDCLGMPTEHIISTEGIAGLPAGQYLVEIAGDRFPSYIVGSAQMQVLPDSSQFPSK